MSKLFKLVGIKEYHHSNNNLHHIIANTTLNELEDSVATLEGLISSEYQYQPIDKSRNKRVFSVVGVMDMSRGQSAGKMEIALGNSFDTRFINKISSMVGTLN